MKSPWTPLKEAFSMHAAVLGDWPGAAAEAYKRARRDVADAAVVDGRHAVIEPSHVNCRAHGKRLRRDPEVHARVETIRGERPDLVAGNPNPPERLTKLQEAYARHFVQCGVQRWAYQKARAEVSPGFRAPTPSQATDSAGTLHRHPKVAARIAELAATKGSQAGSTEPDAAHDVKARKCGKPRSSKRARRGLVPRRFMWRDVRGDRQRLLIDPATAVLLLGALDAIRVVVERLAAPTRSLAGRPAQTWTRGSLANDRERENSGEGTKAATQPVNQSEAQCCAA